MLGRCVAIVLGLSVVRFLYSSSSVSVALGQPSDFYGLSDIDSIVTDFDPNIPPKEGMRKIAVFTRLLPSTELLHPRVRSFVLQKIILQPIFNHEGT
ncbi:hypothetical protein F2Q70_00024102 [Brassica cretica]|uniref:Uncharacterized protein n=1 Tax=Brassica cretica TaxID=69181 RepID=A0A8S9GVS1_BRACR|nr:hypothetical protein F2Q70_00024102 [Brassica cretica]